YEHIPPFAIGRMAFDDWMVADAVMRGIPVVDATDDVVAVHQNHDYGHIGGRDGSERESLEAINALPEVRRNVALSNEISRVLGHIECSNWVLKNGLLHRRFASTIRNLIRVVRKQTIIY
ncbi:MAG: hypothetical protein LBR38_07100, partial [Synergistaceae bacterium]|nr:hypothetical protein [Synergistaceae bacterium]